MPHFAAATMAPILLDLLGPDFLEVEDGLDMFAVKIYASSVVRCLTLLRDHPRFMLNQLTDITAIDHPDSLQRFHVVYHMLSHLNNFRVRIKIAVEEDVSVPSCVGVFPNANWYEREIWDLFGITFVDHPDLRRILTDYNFEGHPLRKDFPLSGYVQVKYDKELGRVAYEPVKLAQDYRSFDFLSPWEGMLHPRILPGDEKANENEGDAS
jgi:NADH-quinone oxidoreductase subunit C